MYNNDPKPLNAGAYANLPQQDIRLSGDQTPQNQQMASMEAGQEGTLEDIYQELIGQGFSPREAAEKAKEIYNSMGDMSRAPQQNSGIMASAPQTYTQRRRAQMAGGGIMGSNNGSMLVAPTADGSRPGYAWWNPMDWIPNEIKDPIAKVIPNELKNPAAAIVGGSLLDKYGLPDFLPGDLGEFGEGWLGDLSEKARDVPYIGGVLGPVAEGVQKVGETIGNIPSQIGEIFTPDKKVIKKKDENTSKDPWYQTALETILPGGKPGYVEGGLYNSLLSSLSSNQGDPGLLRQIANIGVPLEVGRRAGDYQREWLAKQPKFAEDTTGINFQTARQAMDDEKQRFKPPEALTQLAAEGGRIGYADGTPNVPEEFLEDLKRRDLHKFLDKYRRFQDDYERRKDLAPTQEAAQGGRIGAQEGGLMNLGGMEKDYRQEGGFVPLGGEEKADDVPARLSKNEFVFTADAVRAAGGGDIDQGAEVMENLMTNLEAGGEVSEDSQGLEGARGMFANAQQLEKRII